MSIGRGTGGGGWGGSSRSGRGGGWGAPEGECILGSSLWEEGRWGGGGDLLLRHLLRCSRCMIKVAVDDNVSSRKG